jgi:hypothetical protein
MTSLEIGLLIWATVVSGALLGMLLGRRLPSHHMSSETKSVISASMAVLGTMTALVIGLLISSAHSSYSTRNGALAELSADIIQLDGLLRRYGPEAAPVRQALQRYVEMETDDLTHRASGRMLSTDDPAPFGVLDQMQDLIVAQKTTDSRQQWLVEQSMRILGDMDQTRRLLFQQDQSSVPLPFLFAIVLWSTVLFASFGLFAPKNVIAVVALFVCAFAVSTAIKVMLDMDTPFGGNVRMSGFPLRLSIDPMRHALEVVGH